MMVEKPELTDKEKALKSLRLLFNAIYAPPDYYTPPNDIYEARRTIEKFIENAGVLEATEFSILPDIEMIGGIRYATNEHVRFSKWHDELAKIVCILAQQNMVLIRLSTGTVTPLYYGELMKLNPEGSK